jgi:hypothetical protein
VGLFSTKLSSHGGDPNQQEKSKKKKKWKNGCRKKPVEFLSALKEVPWVFFLIMKVCGLEIL